MRVAFEKEYMENWVNVYTATDEASVSPQANVVRSHAVYKFKQNMNGSK